MKQIVKKFILALTLLSATVLNMSGQTRRPVDAQHPLWFIHVDVWYKADPQKIIDLIPDDVRPYVCLNLSLSCGYDKDKNVYKMPHYAFQTYKSWATVCQKNGMWFTCQPASGGHTHIQDDDMVTFEYFFKKFPNFLGWNYAEQFWGFDESGDKSSATQTGRWALFARLVNMSHQYGGLLTVSFCGNIWSHGLNPIGELKRNTNFLRACRDYPENILFLYKYTTSSCFYNNESVTFGPFVSGLTKAYGVRYDNCGWNGAMDALKGEGKCKYPAAAGIGTVMEQTCVNGGSVWDGPELTWREECFHEVGTTTVDGYTRRQWERFPIMDGVWIDMFRKVIDGTMYIPTREEVVKKTKIVVINDVSTGNDEDKYATWGSLYDGIYKQKDPMNRGDGQWMNNFCYFKSTGRYGAIPMVIALYDSIAKTIPVQVRKSEYTQRWGTTAKKMADFQEQYPEVSKGDLYVNRYRNQLVTYNPHSYLNGKQRAEGVIPLRYNTCTEMELRYDKLSSGLVHEYEDHIDFYLNNYRTDSTSLRADTIILRGVATEPSHTLTKHSAVKGTTSATPTYDAATQTYTLAVKHCGALDLTIQCAGNESRSTEEQDDALPLKPLAAPAQPQPWRGEIIIEAEDMDYKSVRSCNTDPYNWYPTVVGHSGNGFVDMGTSNTAGLRHQLYLDSLQAGDYVVTMRYTCATKEGSVAFILNGKRTILKCEKTAVNEWRHVGLEAPLREGRNNLVIINTGALPIYIDQISYRPADVAPMTYYVTVNNDEYGTITPSANEAAEGDTVTLTINTADGYQLKELRVVNSVFFSQEKTLTVENGGLFADSLNTKGTLCFVMPNDNVTLKPVYSEAGSIYKLDFSNVVAGAMPQGWRSVQGGNEVHEYPNTYGQGSRTMSGFNGYQGKGLYWREVQAEYGRQTAYPLTLQPGKYKLTYAMAAWKGTPTYKLQVIDKSTGKAIAATTALSATPNANGSTAANLSASPKRELEFTVEETADFVISFTNASGGFSEYLLLECRLNAMEPESIKGDVNGDGVVDVADIASIITFMAGNGTGQTLETADVNEDGAVDVADIAAVIDIMAANARQQQ